MTLSTLTKKDGSTMKFAWAETLDDPSTGDANFGHSDGRATAVVQMEFHDLQKGPQEFLENVRQILGYAYVAAPNLRRVLPLRHPLFSRMVAESITGLKLKGYRGVVVTPWGKTASYQRAEATVSFRKPPYAMASDTVIARAAGTGKERFRFTENHYKPLTRAVTSEREQYAFLKTPNGGGKVSIKQGVTRTVSEGSYTLVWYHVPREFIYGGSSYNRIAANIVARVNRVNHQEFDGFPPGTLLLEDAIIDAERGPLTGSEGVWAIDGEFAGATYKVTLPFKVYRPKLANAGDKDNFTKSGHNSRVHPDDGLAYPIGQTTTERPPYGGADMGRLFEIMNPELDPDDVV